MQSRDLAVVILAAGQGTRMKSATAKVLHPLSGLPLIGHVLVTAEALEPAYIAVVVRHNRDEVAAEVLSRSANAIIVDQDELPGTGRAVEQALLALPADFDGQVVILSADVPLLGAANLRDLLESHAAQQSDLSVVSTILPDPTGFGRIIRDSDNLLAAIVEHKDADEATLQISEVNAGVYIANAKDLTQALAEVGTENAQHEKYLTDAVAIMRNSGKRVAAAVLNDHWLVAGINDRVQLSQVAFELNARIVRSWQLAGVTVQDPASTWIDSTVTLAKDVVIWPGTQLLGATKVDEGAIIGPDSTLVDCEVGAKAVVKRADATLSVIGAGVSVGPFAYLRPNTVIGENAKIGTFVETKNSRIGAGAKIPHLSYIGDATIGDQTNIGAGAITANYDGQNKHRTTIGRQAKVGTQNVFVAPVSIGDGAYTGAGATIRKDVPAGALAVTAAQQRNLVGWVQAKRPGTAAAAAAAEANQAPEEE